MHNDPIIPRLHALFRQAQENIDLGRLDDAEAIYCQALTWLPSDPQLRLTLGLLHIEQGRHASAISQIERSIELDPLNPTAYLWLSSALEAVGRLTSARKAFRKAEELKRLESCNTRDHQTNQTDSPSRRDRRVAKPSPGQRLLHQDGRSVNPETKINKVLLVSPIHGGSLEVVRYLAKGFENTGRTTLLLDNSAAYPDLKKINESAAGEAQKESMIHSLLKALDERLLDCASRFRPDLVMAVAQTPLENGTVRKLRSQGISCAYWFVEDYRFRKYWAEIAPAYDYFFMIQRDEDLQSKFKQLGYTNWHYLPLACDPSVHKPWPVIGDARRPYECQIGFMGAPYLNRLKIFDRLTHFDLKIWGEGWCDQKLSPTLESSIQNGGARTSPEESVRIYASADIIVNLHSSPFVDGISAQGDFINPRTFEVAGCGGFQLTDYRCEMSSLFVPGEEIILFHDLEELHALIQYWLPRDQMRAQIARKAQARAYSHHTYRQRAEQILSIMDHTASEFRQVSFT